ncbi:hypothetical protein FMEAI12_4530016 [Parafrankia sp. Ea1.12]|nr:hypothetical protein FMEAI12_4530016 [Parafrankia sp. Ea1.12]
MAVHAPTPAQATPTQLGPRMRLRCALRKSCSNTSRRPESTSRRYVDLASDRRSDQSLSTLTEYTELHPNSGLQKIEITDNLIDDGRASLLLDEVQCREIELFHAANIKMCLNASH